jgi:cell division protease FtsH
VSKNVALWLLVVVVAVALFQVMGKQRGAVQEFTYSAFKSQLEAGNVASVVVYDGKQLEGEFRAAVAQDGRPAKGFTVLLPIANSQELLTALEKAGVPISAKEPKIGIASFILAALPWIVIIGLWLFLLRQLQAGGNRAFSFGKSKAKLLTGDTPKITFADVAGADEAKVELQEIIEFLKDPQKFTRLGGRLPKGALLVGPPGTGKTLLAKAVAGEAGRPFFSMSGSDFVEMFVGVGASRVRDLFEQGKAHAPCIIFIDEIDAVGRHRGAGLGGGHDEREQTLNQLLVEMDGFESNDGVILIAATNRPDVLDPALLRPGRFDRQIVVDAPDVRGREGILRVHTRKIPLAADVVLETIAKGSPGMAGADLANLVNEAALHAVRRGSESVAMQDFESARDRVMMGQRRDSLVLTDHEKERVAYHEGGHAVLAYALTHADPVHKVTILPTGMALGVTQQLPMEERHIYPREYIEDSLAVRMGGRVAELLIYGGLSTGANNDLVGNTELARKMVREWGMSDRVGPMAWGSQGMVFLGEDLMHSRDYSEDTSRVIDEEVKRILREQEERATQVLTRHKEGLKLVAASLLEKETIDGQEVALLVDSAYGRPVHGDGSTATVPHFASTSDDGPPPNGDGVPLTAEWPGERGR